MQKCIFSGLNTKHSLLEGKLTQNDGNVAIVGKLKSSTDTSTTVVRINYYPYRDNTILS